MFAITIITPGNDISSHINKKDKLGTSLNQLFSQNSIYLIE